MKYDEVLNYLNKNPRCLIKFKEYSQDMRGVKKEILSITDCEVFSFIKEQEIIGRESIEKYYGNFEDFKSYITFPYIRIVIEADLNDSYTGFDDDKKYITIHLNKTYMEAGLQEIDLYQENSNVEGEILPWTF